MSSVMWDLTLEQVVIRPFPGGICRGAGREGEGQPWQTPVQTQIWCHGDFLINPGETAEQCILSEGADPAQSNRDSLLQGK